MGVGNKKNEKKKFFWKNEKKVMVRLKKMHFFTLR